MENTERNTQSAGRTRQRSKSSAPIFAPGVIADTLDIRNFIEEALDIWPERYRRLAEMPHVVTPQDVETCPTQMEARSIHDSWFVYQAAEERRRVHSSAVLQRLLDSLTNGDLIVLHTTATPERALGNISLRTYWLSEQGKMLKRFPDPAEVESGKYRRRICYHQARVSKEVKTYITSLETLSKKLETAMDRYEGGIEFEKKYGRVQGARLSRKSGPQRKLDKGVRMKNLLDEAKALVLVAQDIDRILES